MSVALRKLNALTIPKSSKYVEQTEVSPAGVLLQPDQLVGKTIAGKYLIESYLGGGGMSHVYKARHLHIKHKVVAIKLLQSQAFVDPQQVLRLQQEANAAGSLCHRNIIAVQDFGLADPTQPYLVMDYFEGQSLDQLIKAEGSLSIDRLLGILGQICSALAHAHENGVIHRDIKPSNIMVALDEQGKDFVKVVDFGIAKQASNESEISRLTQTGDVLGSPLYMSPEQCLGQTVDGRSDIYSLGCVVYESITGVSPFVGDTAFAIIYKHLNEAPQRFSAAALRNSQVNRLEAIVFRMLAKRPDERHRFMIDIASDLKHVEHHVDSASGYVKSMWQLWKACRSARARKSIVVESGLGVASIVAVMVAVLLVVLPGKVKQSALEEARNQTIMTELKIAENALMSDDSVVADLFARQEDESMATGLQSFRALGNFKRLSFLCAGHREQRRILEDLQDSVFDSAVQTLIFKHSMARRGKDKPSGTSEVPKPKMVFPTMMTSWSNTLGNTNRLLEESKVLWIEAQKERGFCENLFEVCKWIGVLLLLVIPSLLTLRWLNRRKAQ